ncbi:hypothetical protein DV738_g237, partial [Chaetothyriales sp. CBS 135597]
MAGQAPIQNLYPHSPGTAWNAQDYQQAYQNGEVPDARQQLNMGFLKRFPNGQVPKRRGPKPDSKPAQTRRQELNRQAQRTHRERKEQYIKALEMELDRFKEVYVNDLNQVNHVRRENILLREILASRGINADQELAGRGLDTGIGMQVKDSNSISPPQMQQTRALSANVPYLSQTPSATGYSPMGDNVFPTGSGTVSVATHSPGMSMQSYGTHHSSPSGPDVQELAVKQEADGVPAMPGIFEHNPQLAVDFILQLEQTCRDHGEYLVRRSVASPDTVDEAQISGHALMASVTPVRHVREVRPEQGGLIPTRPHQMADTETLQLLQNLLRTSSEAKQAMNLLGGQVTPVMAMQSLRSHRYYHSLTEEDVRKMIEAIKGHVRCYGFGAVMEDFELRDALDVVFATKPEAYDSIGDDYPAETKPELMADETVGNKSDTSLPQDRRSVSEGEQDEDETDIELLREAALDIARKVVAEWHAANAVSSIEFLAIGGYNRVWLVKYRRGSNNYELQATEEEKFVLRTPRIDTPSLQPYQLRHEVACLRFLEKNLARVPAPRVYAWSDGSSCSGAPSFIAEEFIEGQRLSVVWPRLTESQKTTIIEEIANVVADLGETRFQVIGGFVNESPTGPTIEAAKVFNGRTKFHSPEYYNIGPYADSKEYILACYDREISYYTHASETDIIEEAFENTSVADFLDTLKRKRLALMNEESLFRDIDAEPRVLVHEDFHAGNMLVRDGHLVGILDWEFSGVYPLSELLCAAQIIQVSSPGRDEHTEEEETEWEERYFKEADRLLDVAAAMPGISLADTISQLSVDDEWGPPVTSATTLDGVPYAPFSKGDKLGRMADWTQEGKEGRDRGGRQYGRNYRDQQVYGAGTSSLFAVQATEDESSFSVVDNTRSTAKNRTFGRGGAVFRGRGQRGGQRGARGGATYQRVGQQGGRGQQQNQFYDNRGGRGGRGRRFGWRDYDKPQRHRDASVNIRPDWVMREEIDFNRLTKLNLETDSGEDVDSYGFLYYYDRSYDKPPVKNTERKLGSLDRAAYNVTTSADPVIQELAEKDEATIFATSDILSMLMCATRSVYSWDLVIVKHGSKIFLDKRPDSSIDLVTVNENAADAPLEADSANTPNQQQTGVKPDSINTPHNLAMEATIINHNFALQTVLESSKVEFAHPNPFYNASEETDPLASKAYKYRRFDLSLERDEEPLHLIVRTELDAVVKNNISGEDQFLLIKALNEFDHKAQGAGGALDWRTKLVSQRGAVVATEMKNNSCKLARWTTQAILAKADQIKLGFVSRANPKSSANHIILGVMGYKPREFANQMNLGLSNGWGIVRTIVDLVRGMDAKEGEEGTSSGDKKFVLVKDPNKPVIRLYEVPLSTFEEDDEALAGTGPGESKEDEDGD